MLVKLQTGHCFIFIYKKTDTETSHPQILASFQKFQILACHPGNLSSYQAPTTKYCRAASVPGKAKANREEKKKKKRKVAAQLGSRTTGARHLSATAPAAARKATAPSASGRAKPWSRRGGEEPGVKKESWLGSGRARQRKLSYRPGEESKRAPGVFAVIRRRLAFVALRLLKRIGFRFVLRGPGRNLCPCRWIVQVTVYVYTNPRSRSNGTS